MVEGTDVNPLEFLASQFPGFAAESLAEVFFANGGDLNLTIEMLTQLEVWDQAEEFVPERFDLEGPVPNESNTDYRFIPFSGGPRKCVGDQFALLEAIVSLAVFLQHMSFELVPDQKINMTTGATIHTTSGLYMKVTQRQIESAIASTV